MAGRSKCIIAVFGGGSVDDQVLARAEALGAAIADEKQIVLTGGDGPSVGSVKGCALRGAESAAGSWIGVDRGDTVECVPSGRSLVITSDLDHKRNYLEALLCDGAIVLDGDKGTRSEATSALSLERSVAFFDDGWSAVSRQLDEDRPAAVAELVAASRETFAKARSTNHALDDRLSPTTLSAALGGALRYRWFPSSASPAEVVRWIVSTHLDDRPLPGAFPRGVHDEVFDCYAGWLAEHADA